MRQIVAAVVCAVDLDVDVDVSVVNLNLNFAQWYSVSVSWPKTLAKSESFAVVAEKALQVCESVVTMVSVVSYWESVVGTQTGHIALVVVPVVASAYYRW